MEASETLSKQPSSMQLRYLQTLTQVAGDKSSTLVFPIPVDLLSTLMGNRHSGPGASLLQHLAPDHADTPEAPAPCASAIGSVSHWPIFRPTRTPSICPKCCLLTRPSVPLCLGVGVPCWPKARWVWGRAPRRGP